MHSKHPREDFFEDIDSQRPIRRRRCELPQQTDSMAFEVNAGSGISVSAATSGTVGEPNEFYSYSARFI